MPYIKSEDRTRLDAATVSALTPFTIGLAASNSGELNYLITEIISGYLSNKGKRYQTMNDIVGALDGAKAEFQRRVVAPYEDVKIEENGDVY